MTSMLRSGFGTRSIYFVLVNAGPERMTMASAASAIQKVRPVGSFISAPGSPRPLLLGVQSQRVGVKLLKVRAAEIAVRGHHVARNPAEHELLERSRIRGPVHPRRAQARRRRVGV